MDYYRMPLDAITTQYSYADDRTPIVEAFASGGWILHISDLSDFLNFPFKALFGYAMETILSLPENTSLIMSLLVARAEKKRKGVDESLLEPLYDDSVRFS